MYTYLRSSVVAALAFGNRYGFSEIANNCSSFGERCDSKHAYSTHSGDSLYFHSEIHSTFDYMYIRCFYCSVRQISVLEKTGGSFKLRQSLALDYTILLCNIQTRSRRRDAIYPLSCPGTLDMGQSSRHRQHYTLDKVYSGALHLGQGVFTLGY